MGERERERESEKILKLFFFFFISNIANKKNEGSEIKMEDKNNDKNEERVQMNYRVRLNTHKKKMLKNKKMYDKDGDNLFKKSLKFK